MNANKWKEDAVFFLLVLALVVLTAGTPDLLDRLANTVGCVP